MYSNNIKFKRFIFVTLRAPNPSFSSTSTVKYYIQVALSRFQTDCHEIAYIVPLNILQPFFSHCFEKKMHFCDNNTVMKLWRVLQRINANTGRLTKQRSSSTCCCLTGYRLQPQCQCHTPSNCADKSALVSGPSKLNSNLTLATGLTQPKTQSKASFEMSSIALPAPSACCSWGATRASPSWTVQRREATSILESAATSTLD